MRRLIRVLLMCALGLAGSSNAALAQDWGSGGGMVSPPSAGLVQQVQDLGNAGAAAGLDITVDLIGGVLHVNGIPTWELNAGRGSDYGAIASFSQPTNIAINLGWITWGDVGSNDPSDIAELFMIAVHEGAHKVFAEHLLAVCETDVLLWAAVIACHREFGYGGNVCNEAYAYSKTIRELCSALDDLPAGSDLREAVEGEIVEQMERCSDFEALCAAANEECGPPDMPMPPDHEPCGGCEACAACQEEG